MRYRVPIISEKNNSNRCQANGFAIKHVDIIMFGDRPFPSMMDFDCYPESKVHGVYMGPT